MVHFDFRDLPGVTAPGGSALKSSGSQDLTASGTLGAYALALLIGVAWVWRWAWQLRTRRLRRRNGRDAWVANGG